MEKEIDWNCFTQAEDEKCLKVVYAETHVLSGVILLALFVFFPTTSRIYCPLSVTRTVLLCCVHLHLVYKCSSFIIF